MNMIMKNCILSFIVLALFTACTENIKNVQFINQQPPTVPNIAGATIPPNIAPFNFATKIEIEKIDVVIKNSNGREIHSQGTEVTDFEIDKWHEFLNESVGDSLTYSVCLKREGQWTKFKDFKVAVSPDSIDYGISYRLIAPGYESYSEMGIYQRELSTFEEKAIFRTTLLYGNCVNCHAYKNGDTKNMSLHFRGLVGCTMIQRDGKITLYNSVTDSTKGNCVYPYWHPDGEHIAYSVNRTEQAFHVLEKKRIEVFDIWSDVVVFDVNNCELISCSALRDTNSFETFPAFSPDGHSLYFCSSKAYDVLKEPKKVRYSLCRIDFDATTNTFGDQIDTLINAEKIGKSVSFPRPSPDSRYIAFTLSDYGQFSIWHPEADIWLYEISTGEMHPMSELNSSDVESYHSWSSNGRWMIFSSRRENGLFTQPYIAHIDSCGKASKPFRLPLHSPKEYDETFYSYNIPEFITSPVNVNRNTLENKLLQRDLQQMKFTGR